MQSGRAEGNADHDAGPVRLGTRFRNTGHGDPAALRAPYSFEVSSASGTSTKRGSPTRLSLWTFAIFIASETVATYSGELCPIVGQGEVLEDVQHLDDHDPAARRTVRGDGVHLVPEPANMSANQKAVLGIGDGGLDQVGKTAGAVPLQCGVQRAA